MCVSDSAFCDATINDTSSSCSASRPLFQANELGVGLDDAARQDPVECSALNFQGRRLRRLERESHVQFPSHLVKSRLMRRPSPWLGDFVSALPAVPPG